MKTHCPSCGAKADDNHDFCASCGADSSTGVRDLSPDADGKYHWYYELNLFTNPTAFITLCMVFGGVVFGCGLLIGLLSQQEFSAMIRFILSIWLWGFGGFLVIGGLSYVIYTLIQGGKYCVIFEMDANSVTHIQVARQFKKAQVIAALATLAGAVQGSLTLMGTGILVGSRASIKTEFELVDKIKENRNRQVIYLHSAMAWNQVYASPENYDAVLTYIMGHVHTSAFSKIFD